MKRAEMQRIVTEFQDDLNSKVTGSKFLFGEEPTVADFAAYHLAWFGDLTRPGKFFNDYESASAWQTRMHAFGHGKHTKISKELVFQTAMEGQPRALRQNQLQHEHIGKAVTIKPSDYARDSVTGQLAGADENRWIIARHTEQFGTLHVHFPQSGYELNVIN